MINLIAELLPRKYDPMQHPYAECEVGVIFQFAATPIRNMPDDLIETIISHELLHAARSASKRASDDRNAEEEIGRSENIALGYDEEALDWWVDPEE